MPSHTGGSVGDPVMEGLMLIVMFIVILVVGKVGFSIIDAIFRPITGSNGSQSGGILTGIAVICLLGFLLWLLFDPT